MPQDTAIPPQNASAKVPAALDPAVDQDELSLTDLAKAILARDIRPRVNSIRRLAEAVVANEAKPSKKKKKAASGGKASNKKRKLAKIPGQKKDQKKGK